MKNKGKWTRLWMGMTVVMAFLIFQGTGTGHGPLCLPGCGGEIIVLPAEGALRVHNLTNNHIQVMLIPMDDKGIADSFGVTSPLSDPSKSVAIKLMAEGEYVCMTYLISALDKSKLKYVFGKMVKISASEDAEIRVVSNEIF